MARISYVVFFICLTLASCEENAEETGLLNNIEENMENKIGEVAGYFTEYLKGFNEKRLVNSDLGRMLHYEELKPKAEEANATGVEGRNMKKMTSLLPLIFHLGMTSAWMLLTTLLAAKSVAIGLTLLVLKIAVGSAKLASYFTAWKGKHHQHHHEYYVPHHDHHGDDRSLTEDAHHIAHTHDWQAAALQPSYTPEWTASAASPEYQVSPYQAYTGEYAYPTEVKKSLKKSG